jgi:alpha-L-fucosidase 2
MYKLILFIVFYSIIYPDKVHAQKDVLWYKKPAINFNEALPVGNGRIGAMIYGGVKNEYISLNENTLWSGGPDIKWNNPDGKKYLPLVRAAALKGDYKKADSLSKFMQGPYTESYMPMADLSITYKNITDSSNYKRTLNLDSAVSTTTCKSNGINFKRIVFASFPDSVLVIRMESDKKKAISFDILLSSKLHFKIKAIANNEIVLTGKCPKHVDPVYMWEIKDRDAVQYGNEGISFTVRLKVLQEGGKLLADSKGLHLLQADAATILITASTSFNGFDVSPFKKGRNDALLEEKAMQIASRKSYDVLLSNHIKDYTRYYERVTIDFGKGNSENLPTDERLKKMPLEFDPALLATIVQYGRYILIASSRAGGQPSNLKGLWNEKLRPEYSANWCIDHDAQMSYYPVETNNLSEMHQPFLKLIKELSENGYKTAAVNYGMRGWCAHHNTDIWRKSSPVGNWGQGNPHWANWNVSGAWLSQHYFEHYQFTSDTNFLSQEAYPIMKGAAEFFLDWLIPSSNKKYLISVPSVSPENTFITQHGDTAQISVSTTSDIELIKDLFTNLIKTASILNIQNAFIDSVHSALDKLLPYPIGSKGQLLEWQQDWRSVDPAHRHLSHMYAVFPGSEISPLTTPELAEAAKKALSLREKTNGSWGFAWKAACWARLYEGDSAWQTLQYQLQYVNPLAKTQVNNLGLFPNLFNSEVPGVILNGNTCITAAITEMLLQSHTGIIDLLPALPQTLKKGEVKGLVARGGFLINISWEKNALTNAVIHSTHTGICKIKLIRNYAVSHNGIPVILKNEGNGIHSFDAVEGETYVVKPEVG